MLAVLEERKTTFCILSSIMRTLAHRIFATFVIMSTKNKA